MKYTHYAPIAPLTLATNQKILTSEYNRRKKDGETVGVILFEEDFAAFPAEYKFCLGKKDDLKGIAANLFTALRYFDNLPVTSLLCPMTEEKNIGIAIMNRLKKAAGGRII